MSSVVDQLTEIFQRFPGIGPRQAKRFVYYLLTRDAATLDTLTKLVKELKDSIAVCSDCHRFFQKDSHSDSVNGSRQNGNLCPICRDPKREHSLMMIVSRDVDLESIEKTHAFKGVYFVLGGTVPILEKNPTEKIRSKELLTVLNRRTEIKEIILATNLNPEGENTAYFVEKLIEPIKEKRGIKISHLGRGISTGTELEYSDSETIKNALKNRQ